MSLTQIYNYFFQIQTKNPQVLGIANLFHLLLNP